MAFNYHPMKKYINNLIPRLREHSESLDRKELFIDIPWVFIDESLQQQKYIFKRDGSLIMSLNGKVTIGTWEYLSAARSLLIDRVEEKILLNQHFIDAAVMVLKRDGSSNELFYFANEIQIPDLDIVNYLKRLYYTKNNIVEMPLKEGGCIEINDFMGYWPGTKVTIEGEPVSDGTIELANQKKYLIKDSKIKKILVLATYPTNLGNLVIEKDELDGPKPGDLAFMDGHPASDGRYRLAFLKYITVEKGRIIKT